MDGKLFVFSCVNDCFFERLWWLIDYCCFRCGVLIWIWRFVVLILGSCCFSLVWFDIGWDLGEYDCYSFEEWVVWIERLDWGWVIEV